MKTPNAYTTGNLIRDTLGAFFLAALAIAIYILA